MATDTTLHNRPQACVGRGRRHRASRQRSKEHGAPNTGARSAKQHRCRAGSIFPKASLPGRIWIWKFTLGSGKKQTLGFTSATKSQSQPPVVLVISKSVFPFSFLYVTQFFQITKLPLSPHRSVRMGQLLRFHFWDDFNNVNPLGLEMIYYAMSWAHFTFFPLVHKAITNG